MVSNRHYYSYQHDFPEPVRPPYYSVAFFFLIKHVHNNTPLNLAWVSFKPWYQLLLAQGDTHTNEDQDSPPVLIRSKFEDN